MTQHDPTDDTLRELGSIAFRVGYASSVPRHDAEDIAQEAVTRAVVRWRRVDGA